MSGDRIYPCADCGCLRTAAEGGTTFTVCDTCWEKHYGKLKAPNEPKAPEGASPEGPTPSDYGKAVFQRIESEAEVEGLRAEVVSLREALEAADKWMMHAHYCGRLEEGGRLVCTCGYAEIKAKIEQSKGVGHG